MVRPVEKMPQNLWVKQPVDIKAGYPHPPHTTSTHPNTVYLQSFNLAKTMKNKEKTGLPTENLLTISINIISL